MAILKQCRVKLMQPSNSPTAMNLVFSPYPKNRKHAVRRLLLANLKLLLLLRECFELTMFSLQKLILNGQFEIEMTLFIFSVLYIEKCERNFQCEAKNRSEND